jgi:predicted nucleotidyltransferase
VRHVEGVVVKLPPPLDQIRPRLERAFGERLRGVILYGSRARGDHGPDSDLDLLVLLDGPIALAKDIGTTVHALYPLQLEVDYPIHATPTSLEEYTAQDGQFLRNVASEGVAL